jgi:ankyrin repeat protein
VPAPAAAGADVNARDTNAFTPHLAASWCNVLAVAALLEAGAHPTVTDADGRTPTHCVAEDWRN